MTHNTYGGAARLPMSGYQLRDNGGSTEKSAPAVLSTPFIRGLTPDRRG